MFDSSTRVLIVDDFQSMREMMKRALNALGFFDVIEAENGEVAWNAVDSIQPPIGIIISDWNMPRSTGIDFLKKVRRHSRTAHIPFILVTTEGEKDSVLDAIQAGVSNYIVKPFTTEILRQKLQAVHEKL